ncbi:MAG: hypothetical protein HDR20_12390 [Lachnospiraceae bacterium]|nr:hypothetical protein [Lachnospiraceae bacterium]
MKKKTVKDQLQKYRESIIERLEHWKHIKKNGCNDPFWADGCNMNLIRNHIIYYKGEIAQICKENRLVLPEEYYIPLPPEVDSGYMAKLDQKERVQRFRQEGRKLVTKKIEYDETQLSLF